MIRRILQSSKSQKCNAWIEQHVVFFKKLPKLPLLNPHLVIIIIIINIIIGQSGLLTPARRNFI